MAATDINEDQSVGQHFTCLWLDESEPRLVEEACNRNFQDINEFLAHIRADHIDGKLSRSFPCLWKNCRRDRKDNKSIFLLLQHLKSHTGAKPFKCNIPSCGSSFAFKIHLERHKRTHTGEKPYKCSFSDCSRSFSDSSALTKHKQRHMERPYKCDHNGCDRRFTTNPELVSHLEWHGRIVNHVHNDEVRPVAQTLTCLWMVKNVPGLEEEPCNRNFDDVDEFVAHIKIDHINGKCKALRSCLWENCYRNGKSFKVKHNLFEHIMTHTGEKPFLCNNGRCTKRFTKKSSLVAHKRVHSGLRPYLCTIAGCGSRFSLLSSLNSHIWRHTGHKPYKCNHDGCSYSFVTRKELNSHSGVHGPPKCYQCAVQGCVKAYSSPSALRRHWRKIHKGNSTS